MRQQHGKTGQTDPYTIKRRKRAFAAALALMGDTQGSWAARHKTGQAEVSRTLSGHVKNVRVLQLIQAEIAIAKRLAPQVMRKQEIA